MILHRLQREKMICNICKKQNAIDYRVKNAECSNWIFVCKSCWLSFSETEGYKYGGTRKDNRRKKI